MNRRTFFSKAAAFVAGCALMVKAGKPAAKWSIETNEMVFEKRLIGHISDRSFSPTVFQTIEMVRSDGSRFTMGYQEYLNSVRQA